MGDPNDPKPAGQPEILPKDLLATALDVTANYRGPQSVGASVKLPVFPRDFGTRFQTKGKIGAGGMGQVYLLWDTLLLRYIAMKVLLNMKDQSLVTRFLLEARVTAQAQHPNLVYLFDLVQLPSGELAVLLPFVEGESLKDVMKRQHEGGEQWSIERSVHFLLDIVSAVVYLHEELMVIHRDIKSANILVGAGGQGRLIDLGLAKVSNLPEIAASLATLQDDSPVSLDLTRTDQVLGTLAYMAPEQAFGKEVGPAADVYALGVVLYECIVGQLPIDLSGVDRKIDALLRILRNAPLLPRSVHPEIPEELEGIILRALKKDSAERPTAKQLHEELTRFLTHEEEARTAQVAIEAAIVPVMEYLDVAERYRELVHAYPTMRGEARERFREDAQGLRKERKITFRTVERCLTQALAAGGARQKSYLAQTFGRAFEVGWIEAEHARDADMIDRCREYLRTINDGRYDHLLREMGTVTIAIDEPGVRVTIARYQDKGKWYVLLASEDVGTTPLAESILELSWGFYLLMVQKEGCAPWRLPIIVDRTPRIVRPRLLPVASLPPGFIYIPGSDEAGRPYIVGEEGDGGYGVLPYEEVETEGFLVDILPRQVQDWKVFLDSLPVEEARQHLPRLVRNGDQPWEERVIEGKVQFFPPANVQLTQAVTRISWVDATAYAEWFGAELLPQRWWEIMASPLRWPFPWGEEWVRGFCNDNQNPGGPIPHLLPVRSCSEDTSPFGVGDLSGGVRDWCADVPDEEKYPHWRTRRGGACNEIGPSLRLQSRKGGGTDMATETDGFRLCIPVKR